MICPLCEGKIKTDDGGSIENPQHEFNPECCLSGYIFSIQQWEKLLALGDTAKEFNAQKYRWVRDFGGIESLFKPGSTSIEKRLDREIPNLDGLGEKLAGLVLFFHGELERARNTSADPALVDESPRPETMAGFPRALRILGKYWSVEQENRPRLESNFSGMAHHFTQEIIIAKEAHEDSKRETLLHEILHCVDDAVGGQGLKEEQVRALSAGLFCVIRDNPGAFLWILGKGEQP